MELEPRLRRAHRTLEPSLRLRLSPVALLLAAIASACGGSSGGTAPVATVSVVLASPVLTQGSTTQAVATPRDAAGNELTGRTITWESASTGVASVSATGAVVAVGPGSVLITATSEGKSGSAMLTVNFVSVASVTVSLATPRVGVGGLSQGEAVLRDASGNVLSGRVVAWTSSNPAVATVLATGGLVTGVGLGTSTITARSEGLSETATIAVTAMYPVTALSQTATPSAAVTQPPGVKVTDGSGNPLSGVPVNFSVTAGGGSVTGSPAVTDATGVASLASWTFGPAGAQSVTASTPSAPDATFSGLSRQASAGYDVTLRFTTPMSISNTRAFVDAKERIQEIITGDVPDVAVNLTAVQMASCGGQAINQTVDDVLIVVEVSPIDGVGNILGQAGPCYGRGGTPGFPSIGLMQFDSADLASLEKRGLLEAVVLHEMMHVLGFGTRWSQAGYLAGGGTDLPYFTGPGARGAFNTYNGGTTYPGSPVPVEGSGASAGTAGSHWREADFDDELMTGFLDASVPNPFSATTVASMADMGYAVDITRADPFRWGTATVALRAALQGADQRVPMVDDVRREPMVVLGPDGKPIFP